jgi:hypothetical protein
MVTLRIGFAWSCPVAELFARAGMRCRMVISSGPKEDIFDQRPQHALSLGDCGGGGAAARLGEEAFEVVGEFEVGVAVGGKGIECLTRASARRW